LEKGENIFYPNALFNALNTTPGKRPIKKVLKKGGKTFQKQAI